MLPTDNTEEPNLLSFWSTFGDTFEKNVHITKITLLLINMSVDRYRSIQAGFVKTFVLRMTF